MLVTGVSHVGEIVVLLPAVHGATGAQVVINVPTVPTPVTSTSRPLPEPDVAVVENPLAR